MSGWIVKTDAVNPWAVARHQAAIFGGQLSPRCGTARRGTFRPIEENEHARYRPCGACVPAEHDGPLDAAVEAAATIREAASAAALAAMTLRELGFVRMANSLTVTAKQLYDSAWRAEPEPDEEES